MPRALTALLASLLVAACQPATLPSPTPGGPAAPSPTPASSPAATRAGPDASVAPTGQPAPSVPASGAWARLEIEGDRPAPREDHTWTVAEDRRTVYLFGGRDGATVFDDLWSFDLETERWQSEAIRGPKPSGRFGHEAAWLPGRGLVVWAGQAGPDFFDDIWLLDTGRRAWERLDAGGRIPVARYGSCSGVGPDGRFWISHGFTANGVRFDDTRSFDLGNGRWTDRAPEGDRPIQRCLHACWWTSDGQLALYGGQTNGVPALGDLWLLDPGGPGAGTSAWTEAPDQPAPARQLAAVARRGEVAYIVGGRGTDGEPLADAWIVVDGSRTLTPLATTDPPPARSGAALVDDAAGNRLVMFGGLGDRAFGDVWELSVP